MGQKVGKAHFTEAAKPFLNLSLPAIEALWEAFNDLADGFGVSQYEFKEICAELTNELGINRVKMDERSSALFWLMDQDKNGLVDGIEFISTLAAVSGMQSRQLLEFIFTCYDFDGTGQLTIDEVTLAFKGTVTGLCKLSGHKPPPEEELELLALEAFEMGQRKETDKMPIPELIGFCVVNPESKSWLEFYNDADEIDLVLHDVLEGEVDYQQEAAVPERSVDQVARTEDDHFLVEYPDNAKAMAALPWVDTIDALTPSEYITNKPTGNAPDAVLHLEWVHGYRGNDVRNNVRYMVDGSVVYHAARVGVVYNATQHKQRFMMEHTDEIVCLALHPEGQIVATGEAGARPKILVWDAISMTVLATLKGFHRRAVTHVAFSQDGKKLASVGQDKHSSLAVYDWKDERLIYTARSTQAKVLGCLFAEADTIVTCGVNHIFFWLKEDRGFSKKRGIFGNRGKMQPIVSLAVSGNRVISGTVGGSLYMWVGRNCAKVVKGHMACVNALKAAKTAIISGGKDMRVRLWTLGLEPGPTFNMAAFGACPSIRSVDMSADGLRLLLGTKGCEIYEVSSADGSDTHGGPITIGHYEQGLAGLAVHPSKPEFATVGDDRTVRVWDAPTKSMIRMATLDTAAQAIAYSPDGAFLVVGLGVPGQPDPFKKAGAFVVLNEGDLTLVHEARDSNAPILDARFSPDGQTMALASADHGIYLYAPTEEYEVIARCRKHTEPVVHLDFSEDSEWLQSNCLGNQLYFVNTEKGSFQSDMSAMKDVQWASQTCTMAWPTQGVYPTEADHTEILCSDRSNTGEVLAVGDSFGRLRLFQYPCVVRNALYHQYQGHGFRVTRVKFLSGDSHLITVGGTDRCVFQWRFEEDDELDDADVVDESESEGFRLDMRDGSDLERGKEADRVMDEYGDSALIDLLPLPEKAPPPMPWLSSVSAPKDAPASQPHTPADGLELEWVHGYRGHDSRNNLRYSAEGRIVYPAAGLGVSLHAPSMTQVFNTEHTDEVLCLAVHPSLKYVATGQLGRKPTIVVWEAETGATVQVMSGFHRRAVCQLAFSPDGRYLASVGQDAQHSLGVYEWREGLLKASAVTSTRKVLGLAWDPSSRVLVQCGLKHVTFWEVEGRNLCYHKGLIGRQGVSQAFVSAAYLGKLAVVGASDGHLYVFADGGYSLSRTIKAHESAVYALYAHEAGLLTGGKDGVIKKWDVDLQCTATFDTLAAASSSSLRPRIRSLCLSSDRRKLLVGTAGNEIFELSAFNGADGNNGPLVSCTFRGQLWGLALHPKRSEVAAVGDDGAVRTYSLESRRPLQKLLLDSAARALAYSPTGKHLAVGLGRGKKNDKNDGGVVVLEGDKLSIIHETRDSNEWVRVLRYSPDGQTLAMGSEDNRIYVYNVKDMYSKRFVLSSHRAPVTQLDFSEDSLYLQSVDKAAALVFTDLVTGLHIPSALTVKDVAWASWSLPYGWPVQGLWPAKRASDGSEPLWVSRSESRKLLAVGDSFGRVRLYGYPLLDEGAGYRYFRGHGPEVRKVAWSRDDALVLTAGGQDMCVLQWRHVVDLSPESGDEAKDEEGDDADVVAADGGLLRKEDPPRDPREKPRPSTMWGGKWMKAMVAPSNLPHETDDAPAVELELEHVHGVRSEDVRGNVRYNDRNDIVWHTGAAGVIYDQVNHRQDFFLGHRHDIISLAVSHDGKYVATGEAAECPRVRIWDSSAGAEIAELPAVHLRGIPILAWSRDGRHLASVGQDRHHTVAVYRTYNGLWCDARRVATEKCSESKLLFAVFCGDQSFPLMVGGVKTVMFLTADGGKALRMRKGVFGSRKKVQPVLCGVHLASDDLVVTGTVNGQLYFWRDRRVAKVVQAHTGSVYAIATAELGLVTGGKDGLVKLWDRDMSLTRTFGMMDCDPLPYLPPVHSVCCNRNFTKVVVGMRSGEVFEIGISSGKRVLVTESHSKKQLRGLATNPADADQYATIGDDGVLRLWSLSQKRAIKRLKLDGSSRALGWSRDGKRLAIGFGGSGGDPNVTSKDGALMVVDGSTLEVVFEDRRCKQAITDIKFSRSGGVLALACEDGKVYVHDVARNYSLRTTTAKASDEVRWIDLTDEAEVLQAGTADADLYLFDTKDSARIASVASQRDARWDTITCPFGWYVQGVWPRQEVRGYDVTSVERSHDHKLLAVSCADGEVRMYAYPAQTLPMKRFVTARGHGQQAANVRFSADDQRLVSLDGYTGSVFTYRVVPRPATDHKAEAKAPASKE